MRAKNTAQATELYVVHPSQVVVWTQALHKCGVLAADICLHKLSEFNEVIFSSSLCFSECSTNLSALNNSLFLHIGNRNTSSAGIFHLIAPAFLAGASEHHHCNAVFLSTAA